MTSTLLRHRLLAPLFILSLGLTSACTQYKVVDYPSAVDEAPQSLWVSWDYTHLRIGKKSEAEWLAKRRDRARAWHGQLKDQLALGYAIELDQRLGGFVAVNEGAAPPDGLQLNLSVERFIEGLFIPATPPALGTSVPTVVELRVDFIEAGEPMESIAVNCAVDARLWSISAHDRFEMCGEQLGRATAKYIDDRAAS